MPNLSTCCFTKTSNLRPCHIQGCTTHVQFQTEPSIIEQQTSPDVRGPSLTVRIRRAPFVERTHGK
jgi:hypothetical protein